MWNTNIAAAPRGKYVVRNRKFGPKGRADTRDYEPDPVVLATKCGRVLLSRYLPAGNERPAARWEGLATGEQPVAWRPHAVVGPQPAHPSAVPA